MNLIQVFLLLSLIHSVYIKGRNLYEEKTKNYITSIFTIKIVRKYRYHIEWLRTRLKLQKEQLFQNYLLRQYWDYSRSNKKIVAGILRCKHFLHFTYGMRL